MQKNTARTGSRLFLIEFLIVLFFFLIVSTVCLQLFVRSHVITRRASALSGAQTAASSLAVLLENGAASPDALDELCSFFPGSFIEENSFVICYDQDFQICEVSDNGEESASWWYKLILEESVLQTASSAAGQTQETALRCFTVSVYDREGSLLYELPFTVHSIPTREEALQ